MSAGRVPGRAAGAGLPAGTGLVLDTAGVGSIAVPGVDYVAPGALVGPESYISIGEALIGLSGASLGKTIADFDTAPLPPGWSQSAGAGGTVVDVAGFKGGVSRMSTSVTIGGNAQNNGTSRIVQNASTDRWYFAWRFRIPSTVDVNTRIGMGFRNFGATSDIVIGAMGNSSLANFVLQYDGTLGTGTGVSLGVALDTAWHIGEAWQPGDGKYHARLDGGTPITPVTPASPPSDNITISMAYDNNVAGVNHQCDRDWCLYLYPRM
jgi:hypothetical protein